MRVVGALLAGAMVLCCAAHDVEADVKDMKEPSGPGGKPAAATIQLSSPAFAAGASIPSEHTCEGKDTSPPLGWAGVPPGARSLALIVDDPDAPDPAAPKRVWVHWVVAGIPAGAHGLPAGASTALPQGAATGKNDWGKAAWGGPCPPIGRHRYFFKLYALDTSIDASGLDKAGLLKAMDGHVLARGELVGTYEKKKR